MDWRLQNIAATSEGKAEGLLGQPTSWSTQVAKDTRHPLANMVY
jgi:hypothetical protein